MVRQTRINSAWLFFVVISLLTPQSIYAQRRGFSRGRFSVRSNRFRQRANFSTTVRHDSGYRSRTQATQDSRKEPVQNGRPQSEPLPQKDIMVPEKPSLPPTASKLQSKSVPKVNKSDSQSESSGSNGVLYENDMDNYIAWMKNGTDLNKYNPRDVYDNGFLYILSREDVDSSDVSFKKEYIKVIFRNGSQKDPDLTFVTDQHTNQGHDAIIARILAENVNDGDTILLEGEQIGKDLTDQLKYSDPQFILPFLSGIKNKKIKVLGMDDTKLRDSAAQGAKLMLLLRRRGRLNTLMGETIFNSIRGINGQRDAVFNKAILAAAGHKYVKLGSEHILPSYLATDGTLPKLLANTAYTVYYPNVQNNDIKTIENYFEGKPQALLKPQSPITNYVVTVKIPGGKTYSVGYGWFRNNGRT